MHILDLIGVVIKVIPGVLGVSHSVLKSEVVEVSIQAGLDCILVKDLSIGLPDDTMVTLQSLH